MGDLVALIICRCCGKLDIAIGLVFVEHRDHHPVDTECLGGRTCHSGRCSASARVWDFKAAHMAEILLECLSYEQGQAKGSSRMKKIQQARCPSHTYILLAMGSPQVKDVVRLSLLDLETLMSMYLPEAPSLIVRVSAVRPSHSTTGAVSEGFA